MRQKFSPLLRRGAATLTAGVIVVLSGCGGMPMRPKLVAPQASIPTPDNWSASDADNASPGAALPGEWWRSFADPQLDALIGEAMEQSYSLDAASGRIQVALVQANLAGAPLFPQVDMSLLRNRQRQNFVGLPFPGAEGNVLSNTYTLANLGVNIAWELDLWGRVRAGKFAAAADAEAAFEDLRAARQSLAAEIARQWFAAAAIRQQMELSERTITNYQQVLDAVRFRYERGLRPPLDVRLTLTDLSAAEARRKEQAVQLDVVVRQVQALAGAYPDASLGVGSRLPDPPPPPPAGLPADIVARRPDLLAAERRLSAAGARITEAKASRYPVFSLTAGGGYGSNQLTDVVRGNFLNYNLIGNLAAPLFDGQRLSNQVKLREAEVNESIARFQQTLLEAYREVETALAAERLLAEQQRSLEQNVREAQLARDLSEEQYLAGLSDVLTLLSSERAALAAEANLIEVRRQRLASRVDLFLALGGGFERERAMPAPDPPASGESDAHSADSKPLAPGPVIARIPVGGK